MCSFQYNHIAFKFNFLPDIPCFTCYWKKQPWGKFIGFGTIIETCVLVSLFCFLCFLSFHGNRVIYDNMQILLCSHLDFHRGHSCLSFRYEASLTFADKNSALLFKRLYKKWCSSKYVWQNISRKRCTCGKLWPIFVRLKEKWNYSPTAYIC